MTAKGVSYQAVANWSIVAMAFLIASIGGWMILELKDAKADITHVKLSLTRIETRLGIDPTFARGGNHAVPVSHTD